MPAVSILIPTYNRAAYLPACIESVFAQTFDDYEIIVVDDGSTDDTRQLLDGWIRAGRITYIYQENKGPAAARNTGLRRATGELISFLDSDDLWPRDKLEWQVAHLREHPEEGMVGGGLEYIDDAGEKMRAPKMPRGEISFYQAFYDCPFQSPGQTLIRSRLIHEAGGFDESFRVGEDLDLWLNLARRGCRMVRVPRSALYYRCHASNSSESLLRMYEYCERVIRKHLRFVPASDRREVTSRSYQWMYEYFGQSAIMGCKAKLRKGDGSDLFRITGLVMRLIPVMIQEPSLFRQLCKDIFVPVRFYSSKLAK